MPASPAVSLASLLLLVRTPLVAAVGESFQARLWDELRVADVDPSRISTMPSGSYSEAGLNGLAKVLFFGKDWLRIEGVTQDSNFLSSDFAFKRLGYPHEWSTEVKSSSQVMLRVGRTCNCMLAGVSAYAKSDQTAWLRLQFAGCRGCESTASRAAVVMPLHEDTVLDSNLYAWMCAISDHSACYAEPTTTDTSTTTKGPTPTTATIKNNPACDFAGALGVFTHQEQLGDGTCIAGTESGKHRSRQAASVMGCQIACDLTYTAEAAGYSDLDDINAHVADINAQRDVCRGYAYNSETRECLIYTGAEFVAANGTEGWQCFGKVHAGSFRYHTNFDDECTTPAPTTTFTTTTATLTSTTTTTTREVATLSMKDGLRPDGRQPHERRAAQLRAAAIGAAFGSASVRLGRSAAVAGVWAEVTEAAPEQPALGQVVATVELPALCAAAFRDKQRTGAVSTFLSNALADVLNSPHVLDAAQLHIRQGELYWVLHVHAVCLNYDGNAFDLCLLAALAALEDTSLPALGPEAPGARAAGAAARLVEVAPGAAGTVAEGRRLKLKSRPLPVTFAQLPGDLWVLDPSAGEEGLGASVSLCLVGGRWLVYHQGGGANADRFLSELMPVARTCMPALTELLDGAHAPAADLFTADVHNARVFGGEAHFPQRGMEATLLQLQAACFEDVDYYLIGNPLPVSQASWKSLLLLIGEFGEAAAWPSPDTSDCKASVTVDRLPIDADLTPHGGESNTLSQPAQGMLRVLLPLFLGLVGVAAALWIKSLVYPEGIDPPSEMDWAKFARVALAAVVAAAAATLLVYWLGEFMTWFLGRVAVKKFVFGGSAEFLCAAPVLSVLCLPAAVATGCAVLVSWMWPRAEEDHPTQVTKHELHFQFDPLNGAFLSGPS